MKFLGPRPFNRLTIFSNNFVPRILLPCHAIARLFFKIVPGGEHAFLQAVSPAGVVGNLECAGINRHVVGNERVLQERRKRLHLGLESCGEHREVPVEA